MYLHFKLSSTVSLCLQNISQFLPHLEEETQRDDVIKSFVFSDDSDAEVEESSLFSSKFIR